MNQYKVEPTKIPIDIMVPVHGRIDLTMKCVNALYERTSAPFHLIILDDTPQDDTPDGLTGEYFRRLKKQHDNITYLHSPKPYKEGNEFFNEGLGFCKYDFVATVMNSVTVDFGWDMVAVGFMHHNPKVGIIGFKTLQSSGVIETTGIDIVGFTPIDIGKDCAGHQLTVMSERNATVLAFALLRKEAVKGNMQEGIYNGFVGWDDIDNSFVVRQKGWQIWYCGLGVGIHETRATRGSNSKEALLKNRANAEIFYKRWGYWDLYQKANNMDIMHDKSKIVEELNGLSTILQSRV